MADPGRCRAFGKTGRRRAEERFSWSAIAQQVQRLYLDLLAAAAERARIASP
jgi:starch synthase